MSDLESSALRNTFPSYVAEGGRLYLCGNYPKAIQSFSNALLLQMGDRNCLVARSQCYLKLGDVENSLKDAEASLQNDKTFWKGILQKAETLYAMGDFEFALVFYHRGLMLRPEMREFKVGIQKAQEAINNSVGSPSSIQLQNKGDVYFLSKQAESKKAQQKPLVKPFRPAPEEQRRGKDSQKTQKATRQLLGELYVDKEFLEKLLQDKELMKSTTKEGTTVEYLITSGLKYLDMRTNFWRQQKPIYARERERKLLRQKWMRDHSQHPADLARYILKSLEDIDMLLMSGSAEGSYRKAEQLLKKVQGWNQEAVPNKDEVVGNLHSCIGNAQMELGQMGAALQSYRRDLDIARQCNLPDSESRALDNIGRVYAKLGKFQQAITTWEEKIPLARTGPEKAWLFHEIGRCYLELGRAAEAQAYGERSLQAAEEEGDVEWQLNANVLVAQAQVKLKDFEAAVINFEKALEWAKLVHNREAQKAIISALEETNRGIMEELRAAGFGRLAKYKRGSAKEGESSSTADKPQESKPGPADDKGGQGPGREQEGAERREDGGAAGAAAGEAESGEEDTGAHEKAKGKGDGEEGEAASLGDRDLAK
ncbi:outer dynein arm-docking complex subunit 4 [Ornithorhynchus anatinus]|uniref:Outer dynein arm-docking complex subunit 4 n=1 Tax=Ornithorhynchus anatinus TaxID=9258 RepID=F6XJ23_ORNAN|nr:outer dynein arm-docking complex subunit 4 [Ornithorhynchus anatinus]